MRKLHIIGIGAGDPDHMTVQAIAALNALDVVFVPDKGAEKEDLRRLRLHICERFITGRMPRIVDFAVPRRDDAAEYRQGVDAWHAALARAYADLLAEHLAEDGRGGFLVWGDPSLYDSTLRIIERVKAGGLALDYDVIPGISSLQALAARHRIALNRIGESVAIMPARRLAEGFPEGIDDVVVVLDGGRGYRHVAAEDPDIFWGAYVGTRDECLVAGRLSEVTAEIEAIRDAKRAEKGWVMDTYLLRRRRSVT